MSKLHIARDSDRPWCARRPGKSVAAVSKDAFKALPKDQQCRLCARKLPFLPAEPSPDTTDFAKELGAFIGLK